MPDITSLQAALAWPLGVLSAWFAGEMVFRWLHLPRIGMYAIVGFLLAHSQAGWLPQTGSGPMLLLANIAFGLILFESGHRINLNWLRLNSWIGITSLVEAILTFAGVCLLMLYMSFPVQVALLTGSLSMATSPAAVVRVINEQRSGGQVTERLLHLAVFNSILAVFAFKVISALVTYRTSGDLWHATYTSIFVLALSVAIGFLAGIAVPALLRSVNRTSTDSTLVFAVAVVVVVTLAHELRLSPLLATVVFGLVARHRRISLSPAQRGFGALGEVLSVFLFVFIASTLDWRLVAAGLSTGICIVVVRQAAKFISVLGFSRVSGISLRKGACLGIAMSPISAFVILILEQSSHSGIEIVENLAPLASVALILEIVGPALTRFALSLAHEANDPKD